MAGTYVVRSKYLKQYKEAQLMNPDTYTYRKEELKEMLPKYYDDGEESLNGIIKYKKRVKIIGIKNMKYQDLVEQVNKGEKFVIYTYSVFLLVIRLKGTSSIYFGKKSYITIFAKIRYTILSSICLIITVLYLSSIDLSFMNLSSFNAITVIEIIIAIICVVAPMPSIITNIKGGIDVTNDVTNYITKKINDSVNILDKLYENK